MQLFVAGATGAIGRPLVRQLVARGHAVVALSRSEAADASLRGAGATPARVSLFDEHALADAMAGADVVVRAATHIAGGRPSAADWAENDRIRREGTRALLAAAERAGIKRYLQESVVWLARPPDGSRFDELSPAHPDAITQSALDAEALAEGSPVPGATLRLGWLYGSDTRHAREFASMLGARRLPVIGREAVPFAFLHVEDAAAAFVAAAERNASGVHHVVDDGNATVGGFFDAFAEGLGAKPPMRVPKWIGRLGAGAYVARFLTTPVVTSNARFAAATGWTPRYGDAVATIRKEAERLR